MQSPGIYSGNKHPIKRIGDERKDNYGEGGFGLNIQARRLKGLAPGNNKSLYAILCIFFTNTAFMAETVSLCLSYI